MRPHLKRLVSAGAVAALAASIVPLFTATPAGAATMPGESTVTTPSGAALSSGNSLTKFTLDLPTGAECSGDTANSQPPYLVQSYLISADVDPSTELSFDSNGPVVPAGSFGSSLVDTGGEFYVSELTAPATPPSVTGPVINIPTFTYEFFPAGYIPAGAYNVGIACSVAGAVDKYWNVQKTFVTDTTNGGPAQVSWSVGAAPQAPVLESPLGMGDGSLTATFSHVASSPPSSYTATAAPQTSDTDCATASAVTTSAITTVTPINITGLVNACDYSVVVNANNGVGGPVASNAVVGTPTPGARPAVANLQAVQGAPGSGTATVSWDPPTGDVPTGYDVSISPTGPTITGTGLTRSISGLVADTLYTVTVTPLHPSPYVGTPASVQLTALPEAVLYQELDVTVPDGVLVITQVCGTHAGIPRDIEGTIGFPAGSLPFIPADLDGTGPTLTQGGTEVDPEYTDGSYPNPSPASATWCGVDFAEAQLITSGPGAGQYYAASAVLNQVTVLDTRDNDPGWEVTGTMGDFMAGSLGTDPKFSGDQLGWEPIAGDTGPIDTPSGSYDQAAVAGPKVHPNTSGGLANGEVLGTAAPGEGRGIATLDARLKLLIPVSVFSGSYTGILTITAS